LNILLTGANGFIGRNLLARLPSAYPGARISCLVRSPQPAPSGATCCLVDYRDPDSLARCPAVADADLIFHVAGVTKAARDEDFRRGNVEPLAALLAALGHRGRPPRRLVLISSQAAAGPSGGPGHYRDECEPEAPREPYGRSKLAAERLLAETPLAIPYTILRPSAVYGPGDIDFLQLFRMARTGLNIYTIRKDKRFSTIYVADLVEGIILAANAEGSLAETFFLCGDEGVSWQEFQEGIFTVMGKRFIEVNLPLPLMKLLAATGTGFSLLTGRQSLLNDNKLQLSLPDYWLASNTKARQLLAFQPQTGLLAGLTRTCAWYRAHGYL